MDLKCTVEENENTLNRKKEHMIQSKQTADKLKAKANVVDTYNLISCVCVFSMQSLICNKLKSLQRAVHWPSAQHLSIVLISVEVLE